MRKDFWDGTRWVLEASGRAEQAERRGRTPTPRASLITVVGFLALVAPFGAVVSASSPGSSITVPDGVFGGTTTATVHTGATTWVHATCSQSGSKVYEQYVKTDTNNQAVLTLGPTPLWTSGGASCNAAEGTWMANGKFKVSATTTFSVSG